MAIIMILLTATAVAYETADIIKQKPKTWKEFFWEEIEQEE